MNTESSSSVPRLQQLTFRRGHITGARFSSDGQTIYYSAQWGSQPTEIFWTRHESPESSPQGLPPAALLAISPSAEMAVVLGCKLNWAYCKGTLARVPLASRAPRDLIEGVWFADWRPNADLAVVRELEGKSRLEFPIGRVLYGSPGYLTSPRISPKGDRIAFVDFPSLEASRGPCYVLTVDLAGKKTTVLSGWKVIRGDLVWSRNGDEIWFTGSSDGKSWGLYAVPVSGSTPRLVFPAPHDLSLHDISPNGRVLLHITRTEARMIGLVAGATQEQELSWLDWSTVADLSPDGKTVLFYEWGVGTGSDPYVYLRKSDNPDPVRLGEGKALALSPDGKWALSLVPRGVSPTHLVLLPTGSGQRKLLPSGGLTDYYWAKWFPDGRRLLVVGSGLDQRPRSYIHSLEDGRMQAIAEEGMLAHLVSSDGTRLVVLDPIGQYYLCDADGENPRPIPNLEPNYTPLQWSKDRRFLYVKGPDDFPLRLYRFDLVNHRMEHWKDLAPQDPAGVLGIGSGRGEVALTPDGKYYVYTYWSGLSDLFLVDGLK